MEQRSHVESYKHEYYTHMTETCHGHMFQLWSRKVEKISAIQEALKWNGYFETAVGRLSLSISVKNLGLIHPPVLNYCFVYNSKCLGLFKQYHTL